MNPIKNIVNRIVFSLRKGFFLRPILIKSWAPKKLNLGDCNTKFAVWGWETVDIKDADHVVNFRNDHLPLPDECAQTVLTSHMIEHISDDSVKRLFRETFRILQRGGCFRIACPDMDLIRKAYEDGDHHFFLQNESSRKFLFNGIENNKFPKDVLLLHNQVVRTFASYIETGLGPLVDQQVFEERYNTLDKYEFAEWCVSLLDSGKLNDSRDWGHINAYDFNKIDTLLKEAGFKEVKRSDFLKSENPELRNPAFDKPNRKWISIYVEAIK